jgi:Na+/proline symporter
MFSEVLSTLAVSFKLSADFILFAIFLALNLIIGIRAGMKVETIQDFAIGRKNFSTGAVTSTIVATWTGGGFLFWALQNIYSNGIEFIIALTGSSLCLLLTGQVLAVRMGEFLNNLSVAEAMGDLYGKAVRVITAISGIVRSMGYVAVQFQVIGKMLNMLLGWGAREATVAAAIIVVLYSAFGGIRSVTITDIFQFIAFSIFIPILALMVWNNLKTPSEISYTLLTNPIFSLRENIGWNPKFLKSVGLLLYFAVPALTPAIFQRVSMAKDLGQVKNSFSYAAIIDISMTLSIAWIAILLLADNPNLDPKGLVNHIISRYGYPGLKGLVAVGITAMSMSTADSELNASAVLAVNDIMKSLFSKWKITIIKLRIFTGAMGLCSLIFALRITDIVALMLQTGSYYMPIVSVPLLLAIFGFRSKAIPVLIGMAAGLMMVIGWYKLSAHTAIEGLDPIIPGMLTNLIFLMGSHYLLRQPGGWVGIKDKTPLLAARQERKEFWLQLVRNLKEVKIYKYLQENLPSYDPIYSLFGVYVLGATYSLFFTIPEPMVASYQRLYDIAVHSVLICTAGLLTYPAWPLTFRAKWFITYAWPISIGYVLFVVGTQLVIMSGFHQVQVMIFLLNLIVAALLLDWLLGLILALSGTILGAFLFKLQYGPIQLDGALDSANFTLVYSILLSSTFLLVIFLARQKARRAQERYRYLEKSYVDSKAEFSKVLQYSKEVLREMIQTKGLLNKTAIEYVHHVIYRIGDYMELDVAEITIDQLLQDVKATLKLKNYSERPEVVIEKITEKMTNVSKLMVDGSKIKELLVNRLLLIHRNNTSNKPIRIALEAATLGYEVKHIKDYKKEVEALQFTLTLEPTLPQSEAIYLIHQASKVATPASADFLESTRIIDAHYGYEKVINPTTYRCVIPINVREVRGKVMELLRQPTAADPAELAHPMAIELEKELFDRLADTDIGKEVVREALDVIKKYHAGVKRKSGEPFFTHPIAVALILLGYCKDQDAVIAALLHDTVEDTRLSTAQIKASFGETVAFLVGKVTNLEDRLRRLSLGDHENIKRLINYRDKRVLYVKLADRLHNMRTIQGHSSLEKRKRIAEETLYFFVPMANHVKLTAVAKELEKLSLAVLGKKK